MRLIAFIFYPPGSTVGRLAKLALTVFIGLASAFAAVQFGWVARTQVFWVGIGACVVMALGVFVWRIWHYRLFGLLRAFVKKRMLRIIMIWATRRARKARSKSEEAYSQVEMLLSDLSPMALGRAEEAISRAREASDHSERVNRFALTMTEKFRAANSRYKASTEALAAFVRDSRFK